MPLAKSWIAASGPNSILPECDTVFGFIAKNLVECGMRRGGRGGGLDRLSGYAATPNNSAMKAACAMASCFATHRTRPFRIMFTASIPCNVRHAVENEP